MDEKSIQHFLQVCIRVEETVGDIYRLFSASVACDGKLRQVWARLAQDEDEHAVQLKFAGRLPARLVFRDAALHTGMVEHLLARAQSILQGAQRSRLTAEDALRVSIKLEREFLEVHVGAVAAFADAGMQKLLRSLGSSDQAHTAALEAYLAERYGGRPAAL